MNKLLLLFVIWFSALYMHAERIDVQTAQKVAVNLATQLQKISPGLKSTSPVSISLVYTAPPKGLAYKQPQNSSAPADYYAFNVGTKQGFVIVSGEDRVRPVIGYSPEGEFKTENMPDNIKAWLERYQREITYAVAQKLQASSKTQQEWQAYMSGTMKSSITPVVQLETANWNQGEPYNNWCPIIYGKRAVTGCVATAQAIVMKYYEYPARATGGVSQYYNLPITYDDYDWNNMLLSYDGAYTQAQTDAVAKLMFHCGANVEMEYSPNASGAITAYVAPSLIKNFGYDKQTRHINKESYKWDEWKKIINKELDAKCPVIYDGQSGQGGHAFVCDGYTSEGAYHINWGWGGYSNGYFLLSTLDADGTGDGYDDRQGLTIGIKPMAGNDYVQSLRIFKSITSNTTSVTANSSFSLSATIISEGSTPFNGYINAALVDSNYKIRELISSNRTVNLDLGYYVKHTLYCNATLEPNPTDKVVVVYSLDGINWVIIHGGSGLASEMSVTSGVINPGPDDPNEPDAPLNIAMSYNGFNFSYVAKENAITNVILFSSSNLQIPLRFRYKLKDPSWKSKMNLMYGNDWDNVNKEFKFDNEGIAWMDTEGSKIEYGQIYQYIRLQSTACGIMEYEITVYDETQTQVYATYNCEMNIVNPIQLPYQEIKGLKGIDTPFSLHVSDFGDFRGKDLKVRMDLYTDLPPEALTLHYINDGKPEIISLEKPYEDASSLQGEHLISSFSSTNGNYTIKSSEKMESAWLNIEFIDQSNNKSIPFTGGLNVIITDDVPVTYPVRLYLHNLSASSIPDAVIKGQSLNVTLTPAISYILPETITVTMGGRTLTAESDYSYNKTTGEITIPSVTGEVIINAEGYFSDANTFVCDNLIYRIYDSFQVGIVGPDMSDNMDKKDWTTSSCTIPSEVTHNNQTYSVTAIENEAFTNCTGLYSVTLPASIVNLGTLLFGGCEQTLTEIHSKMQFPVHISDQYTFFRTDDLNGDGVKDAGTATCKLYVPKGTKSSYTVAPGWKEFSNIIEASDVANGFIEESTNHVFVRSGIVYIEVQEPTEAQIVNYGGQVVRSLNLPAGQTSINGLKKGLYIIKYSGNSTARFSIL